jgi:hypothetical protein
MKPETSNIVYLFKFRKRGPLGQVRVSWLC